MGEMKLFEFSANITCAAVVAAKTEEAAREAIKTDEILFTTSFPEGIQL